MKKFFICKHNDLIINKPYKIHNNELVFFYKNKKLCSYSSFCPHFGGPLTISENHFYCHWHGYKFNKSGKCISHNLKLNVIFFKVTIENSSVYVWENT